jgi:transcriptional regulator with XRE-family HTH domain
MKQNNANLNRFREARELAGLSVEQAAKYLSFSLFDLLRIESGEIEMSEEKIRELALFYEVDFEWLKSKTFNTNVVYLGDLQIAPRELEKIRPEELPKLLQILTAIRNMAKDK